MFQEELRRAREAHDAELSAMKAKARAAEESRVAAERALTETALKSKQEIDQVHISMAEAVQKQDAVVDELRSEMVRWREIAVAVRDAWLTVRHMFLSL